MKASSRIKIVDELHAGLHEPAFPHTNHWRSCGYHLRSGRTHQTSAAEALPMPKPMALADGSLSGTEQKPYATAGNPFPAHPQFAKYKQNSGRGEGLIYNIPAAYFQMMRESLEVAIRIGGAAKNASSPEREPLVTCLRRPYGESRFMTTSTMAAAEAGRIPLRHDWQRSEVAGNLPNAAAVAGVSRADGTPAISIRKTGCRPASCFRSRPAAVPKTAGIVRRARTTMREWDAKDCSIRNM